MCQCKHHGQAVRSATARHSATCERPAGSPSPLVVGLLLAVLSASPPSGRIRSRRSRPGCAGGRCADAQAAIETLVPPSFNSTGPFSSADRRTHLRPGPPCGSSRRCSSLVPAIDPLRPAWSRPCSIGQARFTLRAAGRASKPSQLFLFTGRQPDRCTPIEEAVLTLTDPAALVAAVVSARRRLGAGMPGADPSGPAPGKRDAWLDRVRRAADRRRGAGTVAARPAGRSAVSAQYAALWAKSFQLGEFLFQLDPRTGRGGHRSVGSCRAPPRTGWDRARLRHRHPRARQQQGPLSSGMRVEDRRRLGRLAVRPGSAGCGSVRRRRSPDAFEAEHYEI